MDKFSILEIPLISYKTNIIIHIISVKSHKHIQSNIIISLMRGSGAGGGGAGSSGGHQQGEGGQREVHMGGRGAGCRGRLP